MRTLGSNAIYNILYKSLNALFPLVTMAYVSRVLLPVGVGKVASAQNIVSYFVIIASLGLPTYGVKKIAECFDEREKRSKTFSELAVINAISTLICICVYLGIVLGIDYFEDKLLISFIVGIQLFANIFNIDWFYQGIEEYRYIMFRSFIVKLLALASVFIFVHNANDFPIYALIVTLSLVSNYIFNVVNLHKYVDFQYNGLDVSRHLKPVFVLLATTIAIEIYTLADTTMLSLFKGDEIVGYYTNSAKTVGILFLVSRCVDAFTDIGMGRIVDSIETAKDGRFRCWLRRMCGPVALTSFLMYQSGLAGASMTVKLIYMFVTYILWGSIFYTSINIPYGSMASAISEEPKDRAALSVYRSLGAIFAATFISVVTPLIIYYTDVNGNQVVSGRNFTILAGVFSIAAIICYLLCYAMTTERVQIEKKERGENTSSERDFYKQGIDVCHFSSHSALISNTDESGDQHLSVCRLF